MSVLFTPTRIGSLELSHRVVMAPLTRMRSDMPGNVPGAAMIKYYTQRASAGGLIVAEATFISRQGNGGYASPGIESEEQMSGWRRITDAVHARGAVIYLQLWHVGRASHSTLQLEGGQPIAPSVVEAEVRALMADGPTVASPAREIRADEIPALIDSYHRAATLAKKAGFDGVEIHGANGYLIDQFLQDGSNRRTDDYGGSVANRARFLLEVSDAVSDVWGAGQVGVRLGPSNSFNGMHDSDPVALFSYVAAELSHRHVGYLHVIEPRVKGNVEVDGQSLVAAAMLKPIFGGTIIAAGGFQKSDAGAIIDRGDADLVAFGRHFISNPDLPARLKNNDALSDYDRSTFYYGGEKGYIDYPAAG